MTQHCNVFLIANFYKSWKSGGSIKWGRLAVAWGVTAKQFLPSYLSGLFPARSRLLHLLQPRSCLHCSSDLPSMLRPQGFGADISLFPGMPILPDVHMLSFFTLLQSLLKRLLSRETFSYHLLWNSTPCPASRSSPLAQLLGSSWEWPWPDNYSSGAYCLTLCKRKLLETRDFVFSSHHLHSCLGDI